VKLFLTAIEGKTSTYPFNYGIPTLRLERLLRRITRALFSLASCLPVRCLHLSHGFNRLDNFLSIDAVGVVVLLFLLALLGRLHSLIQVLRTLHLASIAPLVSLVELEKLL
jgi:hypothetical protein